MNSILLAVFDSKMVHSRVLLAEAEAEAEAKLRLLVDGPPIPLPLEILLLADTSRHM
jgi:hypothetical protein